MAEEDCIIDPGQSPLGTKEYWDEFYTAELFDFEDADTSECWFGEEVNEKVCDWIALGCDRENPTNTQTFPGLSLESKILDIGCGNAKTLIYLVEKHSFKTLHGVDYSKFGIELGQKFLRSRFKLSECPVSLFVLDIVDLAGLSENTLLSSNYDLIFDKGTFDAICLNCVKDMRMRYICAVCSLMKPEQSYLVINSCNWTENELVQLVESMSTTKNRKACCEELKIELVQNKNYALKKFKCLPHPVFEFRGQTGSALVTVAFKLQKEVHSPEC
ncbi:EEF1A lysine methyltransferase 2-like [Schistocerca gregaria]|uniref:EEF1A lysine methyltransferase 2-like n=1 Tax=Schistocerca gregaria TaxID=7010 RepID=UPI00211EA560|nr:EEF1A lysine methyltransferase 2-like [Schistocerca gregaria]